MDIPKI